MTNDLRTEISTVMKDAIDLGLLDVSVNDA